MLLWNQTWCGPAEYPVTGGVSLTWAQTDNVCCVPDRQMAFGTHKLHSHKIRSALTKLHTYIHAYDTDRARQSHTASHITWGSYERNGKSHALSLSYMQTHALAHGHARTYIHGHSHRSQSSPTARTLVVSHIFHSAIVFTLTQITHTESSACTPSSHHLSPRYKSLHHISH